MAGRDTTAASREPVRQRGNLSGGGEYQRTAGRCPDGSQLCPHALGLSIEAVGEAFIAPNRFEVKISGVFNRWNAANFEWILATRQDKTHSRGRR